MNMNTATRFSDKQASSGIHSKYILLIHKVFMYNVKYKMAPVHIIILTLCLMRF
jgi:hypothetical protein